MSIVAPWSGSTMSLNDRIFVIFLFFGPLLVAVPPLEAQTQSSKWPSQLRIVDVAPPAITANTQDWFNTDGKPVLFEKGRVYLVHFWTFGCINCQRNLPIYNHWQTKYQNDPLTIVGIHTPETEQEKDVKNIPDALERWEITYPIVFDGQSVNWRNWQQQCWPTVYLIDKQGHVRYYWMGELEWKEAGGTKIMQGFISKLLREPTTPSK